MTDGSGGEAGGGDERESAANEPDAAGKEADTDETDAEADVGRWARDLATAADHDSVTVGGLVETVADGGHLFDGPAIDHLEPDEQPHFLFYNTVKGVSTGWRYGSTRPDVDGGTVVLLTDRRSLALLGREDGDRTYSVPHEEVVAVDGATRMSKSRLSIRTDEERYHFWIDRSFSNADIGDAMDFLERAAGLA